VKKMEEKKQEQTRVRINYKISAKGEFQPDITSEAETVATAIANLQAATDRLKEFATRNGLLEKGGIQ
jgi:hypothetical protein